MSRCRFCAEELPREGTERCPACGESTLEAPPPKPTPPELVAAAVLGALFLAMGLCCGLGLLGNIVGFASMAGGGVMPFPGVMIGLLALSGVGAVLHVGAGAGLLARQEIGRRLGIACAALDIIPALLMLVGAGAALSYGNQSGGGELLLIVAVYGGMGIFGLIVAITSLWFLLRATTREAFAARR